MKVRRLHHVSISCSDIDRSVAFYRDVLGLELLDQGESQDGYVSEITGLRPLRLGYAELDLGDGQVLELLCYREPAGRPRGNDVQDPGAGHISLLVEDIDDAHRRLVEAGAAVRSEPVTVVEPGTAWDGARIIYAADPDGFVVELIEWPPDQGGG